MDQTTDWPSEEGRFDSKGLSTRMNAKRESHDHQEIGGFGGMFTRSVCGEGG